MLRRLPRVNMSNLPQPTKKKRIVAMRGIHAKWRLKPNKGPEHHQRYMPAGYESDQSPFILKFPVQKWAKERMDISYVPVSMQKLQLLIDTERIDPSLPIDVTQLHNTGVLRIDTRLEHGGVMLEEEGMECFSTPINLEVQFASEAAIAAVERMGGTITTAYYDPYSLSAALRPIDFFRKGQVIPRRMLPPQRLIEYYSDPRNRGYLSDPDLVAEQRLILSQKYGYTLPSLSESPHKELLTQRKDPRQVFYGLEPGWLVSLADKVILKPKDPELKKYYSS